MAHPNTLADPAGFNTKLRGLHDNESLKLFFRKAIEPFGFDTFACGELDLDHRERSAFYLIDWPDDWRKVYFESGMLERDPVVEALRIRREPFTWSQLRADVSFSCLGRASLKEIADHGWTEGLVVPMPRGERRFGLVSMVGRRTDLTEGEISYLCLISVCLHDHARRTALRTGLAVAPAGLTPREVECLQLVAAGHADRQIADALGIATSTAHEHVDNARRKLKAKNRAELAAIAATMGMIA